jgi:ABC-type nickel/cobalt efflux system permease component RcnA
MRWVIAAGLVALALGLWWLGLFGDAQRAILEAQREFQRVMANAVRALRADEPGAVAGLMWLSFVYGVLHAAGPGHGKVVLGTWAFATSARVWRIAAITLAASMAQAVVAIVMVWGAVVLLGLSRAELTAVAEGGMTQVAGWMLLGLGAWLGWRGLRGFWRLRTRVVTAPHHDHDHDHDHGPDCDCGHAHAPDPEAAARASLPEALALIASVAMRPCSGALLVMVLTVMIGAPWAGAAAVLAMGLGTAAITLSVTLLGARLRDFLAPVQGQGGTLRLVAHGVELVAGLIIAAYAVGMVV